MVAPYLLVPDSTYQTLTITPPSSEVAADYPKLTAEDLEQIRAALNQ